MQDPNRLLKTIKEEKAQGEEGNSKEIASENISLLPQKKASGFFHKVSDFFSNLINSPQILDKIENKVQPTQRSPSEILIGIFPAEIWIEIAKSLDIKYLAKLAQANSELNVVANDRDVWSILILQAYPEKSEDIESKSKNIHPKILFRNTFWKQNPNSPTYKEYEALKEKIKPIREKLWKKIKPWEGNLWPGCTFKPAIKKGTNWTAGIFGVGTTVSCCIYGGVAGSSSGVNAASIAVFLGIAGCCASLMIGVPCGFLVACSINGCYHLLTVPLSNSLEATSHAEVLLQIARYGNVEIALDVPPPSLSMQK